MLIPQIQRVGGLVLFLSVLFLANIPVFVHYFWLIPELIYAEAMLWLVAALVSIWILGRRNLYPIFIASLRRNWIFVTFVIFSGFSMLWSVYWEISLSRWLVLLSITITAGLLGLRYTIHEIVHYLSVFGIYILFLSLMFIVMFPEIGVMNYYSIQGAWKGIYWHKNHMGFIAAFFNTIYLIRLANSPGLDKKQYIVWISLYIISLIVVFQSDTVGAFLAVSCMHGTVFLAFLFLKFRNNLGRIHFVVFGIFVIAGGLILVANLDVFFELLNRNPTLTGRIPMWEHLFDAYLSQRPYFGYGFNAFWYTTKFRVEIGQAAGYPDQIVIADNGFIDLLMNTGYVGLALFLLFFATAGFQAIKYAANARDITVFFPVIYLIYLVITNISWSLIFENEGFIMLVLISILFSMSNTNPINVVKDRTAT